MTARPTVCVGGVVVDAGRLLLVRRGRPPSAGLWSVPGGRVEAGETVAAAVEREVREETGLQVRCGGLVGWTERIADEHHFVILDFWAQLEAGGPEAVAGDDAAAVAWVPLSEVPSWPLVEGLREFLLTQGVIDG